jgi:hypothetical protein
MAIKTSGQLSMRYDILPELGGSYVNLSLRNLSSRAGFSTPDAMSEFYGFSFGYYFNTRRGVVRNRPSGYSTTTRASYGAWFRVDSVSKKNQYFFGTGNARDSRVYLFKAFYYAALNRISVEVYDNRGARRIRREYPLHNSPNVQITGVTNSSTGWERDQRGNTDSNGFVHICVTLDIASRSYTGIRLYWNGQELTYSVNKNSSAVSTAVAGNHDCYIGLAPDQSVGSGNNFEGGIDNFFWAGQNTLNIGEIQTIYNQGNTYPAREPVPPFYLRDFNYICYGAQGFERNLTNQGFVFSPFGDSWEFAGSAYSIQSY